MKPVQMNLCYLLMQKKQPTTIVSFFLNERETKNTEKSFYQVFESLTGFIQLVICADANLLSKSS